MTQRKYVQPASTLSPDSPCSFHCSKLGLFLIVLIVVMLSSIIKTCIHSGCNNNNKASLNIEALAAVKIWKSSAIKVELQKFRFLGTNIEPLYSGHTVNSL